MPSLRALATTFAVIALASCNSADTLDSSGDESDFETVFLPVGQVRVRYLRVPSGYTITDINDDGDMLLGDAWLPSGRWKPRPLPFAGRSINNLRQILGPGASYFVNGHVVTPPSPCTPIVNGIYVWDCSGPVDGIALADNGDLLATYRQDAPGTVFSPYRYLTVWRARTGKWEEFLSIFGDDTGITGTISDHGAIVGRVDNFPAPVQVLVQPRDGPQYSPSLAGACPAGSADAYEVGPGALNDAGELVGYAICQVGGVYDSYGARWSRTGAATPVDGIAFIIDDAGNIAGTRSDGLAVVWLANGNVVELSPDPTAAVRKFVGRGRIFGFIGPQPVIWRFGY